MLQDLVLSNWGHRLHAQAFSGRRNVDYRNSTQAQRPLMNSFLIHYVRAGAVDASGITADTSSMQQKQYSYSCKLLDGLDRDTIAAATHNHKGERVPMTQSVLFSKLLPPVLLLGSNVFMTFAWYGHLRFKTQPIAVVIVASWGIALLEYCLAVPANRWGSAVYSAAQLKSMQEVITLAVFAVFSTAYLNEPLGWNSLAGFGLIGAGAVLVFHPW